MSEQKSNIIAFRLPNDEMEAIRNVSTQQHETVSEYVRRSIAMRRDGYTAFKPTIGYTVSTLYLTVSNVSSWTENRASVTLLHSVVKNGNVYLS